MSSGVILKGIVRAYGALCVLIFLLIILGGAVRVMNAGLSCPDWPLCFGDVIPDYHPQVYLEYLHRVLAGVVALLFVGLNIKVLVGLRPPPFLRVLCWASFVILLIQLIMGGLTVLMQLHPQVVTLHLVFGLALFSCGLWIFMSLRDQLVTEGQTNQLVTEPSVKRWAWVLLSIFCGQIILGGLVASHYAGLVCMDFPLCHGKLIPTLSGIIGLQVLHRLGAYVVFVVALLYFLYSRSLRVEEVRRLGSQIFALVVLQVIVGVSNILLATPPLISVLHLALAVLILWRALSLLYVTGCRAGE